MPPDKRSVTRTQTLAFRLIGWFVVSTVAMIAVTGLIFYWASIAGLEWADDQLLEKRVHIIRSIVEAQNPDPDLIDHEVSEEMDGPRQIFMRVVGPDNSTRHETPNMDTLLPPSLFPDVSTSVFGHMSHEDATATDGRLFRLVSSRLKTSSAFNVGEVYVQVATDVSLDQQVLGWYRILLVVVVGIGIIFCGIAGALIIGAELEPLRRITAATTSIGPAKLTYRLALDGLPQELRDLGHQFNLMLERLEVAYVGLQHYADNVAHELRTPLNKMLLGTEVILRKPRTADEYREALESNIEECEALTKIVQSLLFVARAENAQMTLQKETLRLDEELQKISLYYEAGAQDAGITLTVTCPDGLEIVVDRPVFQRAITNLVANAISHTGDGGRVDLRASVADGAVEISVRDTGEGIAPEHLPHVFNRFFRADAVRAGGAERIGLGLAITKSVVELHGGTISVTSVPGEGTAFVIRLPREQG